MHHDRVTRAPMAGVLVLPFLALIFSFGTASAKKPPKTYPEEGKVIGSGSDQHTDSWGFGSGAGAVHTVYTRTYKIETDTKMYVLDCGKPPAAIFSSNPEECGGDKKIQIGDVIHFRVDKGWVYIPVVETTSDPYSNAEHTSSGEQKLRILSEELKPDAKGPATPPADAKSPDAKQ
jgi:hypothetical protein